VHRSEARQLVECADCGGEIVSERDRSYAFGDESEICIACAIRRGGRYDELHDHWTVAPAVQDLLERERNTEPAVAG
jgi:hypothetical protein